MGQLKKLYYMIAMSMFACTGDMCHSYYNRYIEPLEINSVLINKYIDSTYKDMPRLVIQIDGKEKIISPMLDDTMLYNQVSIGDTLIKKKGSSDFMIISKGDTSYASLNCENRY